MWGDGFGTQGGAGDCLMNDYPTDEQLQFIKDYDLRKEGPGPLIKHLMEIWHWPDYARVEPGLDNCGSVRRLFLSTGGWPGASQR